MSKSLGQIAGGIVGGVIGFIGSGFNVVGAVKGFALGSSIGGMIDPPPGPDLKGPTLEDRSFNSAAYGVSLATLHGTIAHTGSIIYLENNEYMAVTKKQKTGGKGGSPKGSYETTTYFATFAVAIGEAMPGSKLRRIWAGGKLIYSVGESVDWETLLQSAATAGQRLWSPPGTEFPEDDVLKWKYYDGTQTEPDPRMEAVLGVGNCPSYEGTAYIIFYDFDLTEYGNGLQGCPIKVEVITGYSEDIFELPFQKVFEMVNTYEGAASQVRALTLVSALFVEDGPAYVGSAVATYRNLDLVTGWSTTLSEPYNSAVLSWPGLTFTNDLTWHQYDKTAGAYPSTAPGWDISGWATANGVKLTFGSRLHAEYLGDIWDDEPVYGATVDTYGAIYIINTAHIIKMTDSGDVIVSRATDSPTGGTYYGLWYDGGFLYRLQLSGGAGDLVLFVYDYETLESVRTQYFGDATNDGYYGQLQFAVYGDTLVLGWVTRYGVAGTELHYEHWRIKNFNRVEPRGASDIVGRIMSEAGIGPALRDLSELESDVTDGYRITEVGSARGKLAPLQIAHLFDFVEYGFKIKAVKRGGAPIATIPLSDLGARAAGDAPGVLVQRERETDSQLPSSYLLTYLDYNREYDTNTQPANYPSVSSNTRTQSLPVVLTADKAAQLADIYINLAWMERDSYSFSLPQTYFYLKPANVIEVEVAAGLHAVMRIGSLNYTADQRLEVSAKRAEPAVYQSNAVGSAAVPPAENIPLLAPATAVLLDIPSITDLTSGYGFGAAVSGGKSWRGGSLLRSVDVGQTYNAIQSFSENCTLARVTNSLAAGDYFVIDRASTLNINIISGDFFSISESQMLAGKHYCAYGVDGRWEIIQYATASYLGDFTITLSTFVRGLFGSEWAGDLHQPGDMLVLLDDPDNAFIGADAVALNSPRKFKAVTTGQDAQLAAEIDFTYRGVNLKPLSPVNVVGVLDVETWTISCNARTRFASSQWSTGIAAPVGEAASLFEFDIYDGGGVFKKTYQSSTPEFIYYPANQIADFGNLPIVFTVKIYQISAVVGRGYGAQKTLIGMGDIYGDKVALLLHANGANNSTVFVDSSKRPKTITAVGNAKISTTQFKYGGSSGFLDGAGDYLSIAHHADLNLSARKFCIEGFVWCNAFTADSQTILDKDGVSGSSYPSYALVVTAGGKIRGALGAGNGLGGIQTYTGTTTMPLSQWVHVAFTFDGVTARLFLGGAIEASSTSIPALADGGKPLLLGYAVGNSSACYFNGFFDDVRITSDEPRYTSPFSPPLQQLPDPI